MIGFEKSGWLIDSRTRQKIFIYYKDLKLSDVR